ncbi:hypothetical protein D3C83_256970 [compost metagenome]
MTHEANLHTGAKDVEAQKTTKQRELNPEHKHALVAIRDAFDIARRRLQDHARRQRDARQGGPPE